MADNLTVPTKDQLDQNIRLTGRLLKAVECCTFHGRDAGDVAILTGYLMNERDQAKKALDKLIEADGLKFQPDFKTGYLMNEPAGDAK